MNKQEDNQLSYRMWLGYDISLFNTDKYTNEELFFNMMNNPHITEAIKKYKVPTILQWSVIGKVRPLDIPKKLLNCELLITDDSEQQLVSVDYLKSAKSIQFSVVQKDKQADDLIHLANLRSFDIEQVQSVQNTKKVVDYWLTNIWIGIYKNVGSLLQELYA